MIRSIGVAMLGYAFIGEAHSRAFDEVRMLDAALRAELGSISGRSAAALAIEYRSGT